MWGGAALGVLYGLFRFDGAVRTANTFFPALLAAICLLSAWGLFREYSLMLWSPLPWFLLTSAIYFGLGALLPYWANHATTAYATASYNPDEWEIWRTNFLNTLSIVIVLASFYFVTGILFRRRKKTIIRRDNSLAQRIVWQFLLLGLTAKYLFLIPSALGIIKHIVPGSLTSFSALVSVSIIVMVMLIGRGEKGWLFLLIPVVGLEITTAVLLFSKLEIIMALLAPALGLLMLRPRPATYITVTAVLVLTYFSVINLVTAGRMRSLGTTGLAARVEALQYATSEMSDQAQSSPEGVQAWWSRLCYTSAQAFAMRAYDNGKAGETFQLGAYALVPRFLWPSKPIMTPGADFNYLYTGSATSCSAPGVFAEAYWNGGWLLVLATNIYLGALYAVFSFLSLSRIARDDFAFIPIAYIGLFLGLRPDDWFAAAFVGSIVFAIGMYVVIYHIFGIGSPSRRRNSVTRKPVVTTTG
jgi:hypothetical protein